MKDRNVLMHNHSFSFLGWVNKQPIKLSAPNIEETYLNKSLQSIIELKGNLHAPHNSQTN